MGLTHISFHFIHSVNKDLLRMCGRHNTANMELNA